MITLPADTPFWLIVFICVSVGTFVALLVYWLVLAVYWLVDRRDQEPPAPAKPSSVQPGQGP